MDLLALLTGLQAQITDAQKAVEDISAIKFAEGVASRDAEVADLKAQIEVLTNPSTDPLQAQLDAAVAQVADLTAQVSTMQTVIDGQVAAIAQKDADMAAFKAAELEKVKAIEVDFT